MRPLAVHHNTTIFNCQKVGVNLEYIHLNMILKYQAAKTWGNGVTDLRKFGSKCHTLHSFVHIPVTAWLLSRVIDFFEHLYANLYKSLHVIRHVTHLHRAKCSMHCEFCSRQTHFLSSILHVGKLSVTYSLVISLMVFKVSCIAFGWEAYSLGSIPVFCGYTKALCLKAWIHG